MNSQPPLRHPAGLVLAGGGALGAWQAGALLELEAAGLRFDSVQGFSAGSINGAAYALGVTALAEERWAQCGTLLRLRPRLSPPAFCSNAPVWDKLDYAHDDEQARKQALCRLVVSSARWQRDRFIYAEFDAKQGRWNGPLASHLMASCAIPLIFPPVRLSHGGEQHVCLDGGVPTREPFSLAPLGPCEDVVVLEMVRPEELGRRFWNPVWAIDQRGRETCRRLIDEGVADLRRRCPRTRVFRLPPSRPLWRMLDFSPALAREGVALGRADARAFLGEVKLAASSACVVEPRSGTGASGRPAGST